MYKVLKTFLSKKTGTIFKENETIPEDYYTDKELKAAIEGGFVEAPSEEGPSEEGPNEEEKGKPKAKPTAKKEK